MGWQGVQEVDERQMSVCGKE